MKKVGLVVKHDKKAQHKADELESWLVSKKIEVVRKDNMQLRPEQLFQNGSVSEKEAVAPCDLFCVIILGGDGTFLSSSRWIGKQGIPVMGVKFGEVGFLAESVEDKLFESVEAVLQGNFTIQQRMRLETELIRNNKTLLRKTALNDVVINKGTLSTLAHIKTWIDDHYLTTYSGDGLIVSTPTGSTAYSLAAGGPIVHPAVPAIILSPICPFTLTNRPLILSDSVIIKIKIAKKSVSDILLTIDGQEGVEITNQDTVIVKKSKYPVNMIRLPGCKYFDVLKAKLRWSGGHI